MNDQDIREGHVRVEVLYANTSEDTDFDVEWTTTLQAVFDEGYRNLKETPKAGDKLQCQQGGQDMRPYLTLTMEELARRHICEHRKFQIVGETGGAICRG